MPDIDDTWHHADGTPTTRAGQGKRWQARWRDPGGHQRKRSFARKIDAERYLAAVTTDMTRGTYVDPGAGKITVAEFAKPWLASLTADPVTCERAERIVRLHIIPHLGHVELASLRPSMVASWLSGRRKVMADSTSRLVARTLSAMLSAAVEDGRITRNPAASRTARLPRRPDRRVIPWTAGQVAAVARSIEPSHRALVICGAGEGLRQGELLGLAGGDIDWLRRVIHVRRQVKISGRRVVFAAPKGGRTRDVPLGGQVGLALSAHVAAFPPAQVELPWGDPAGRLVRADLLWHDRGSAWRRQDFNQRVWRPAAPGGCHELRHYAASSWLAGGASIRDVAAYLGHADPGFTLRVYAHLMPDSADRLRAAIDAAVAMCPGCAPGGAGNAERPAQPG